jgi:hypothetical protein
MKRIIISFIVLVLCLSLVIAPEEGGIAPVPAAGTAGDIDWNNYQQFRANFNQFPALAFANKQDQAWELLTVEPKRLSQENVLDEAFENDPAQAAGVLDDNVDLLDDKNVIDRYDKEVIGNVHLLNDNPAAKAALLLNKYNLKMLDSSVPIDQYDGQEVTTKVSTVKYYEDGESYIESTGTTFNVNDFPNAEITSEGYLITAKGTFFKNTLHLFIETDQDGKKRFFMDGGTLELDENSPPISIKSDNGYINYLDPDTKDVIRSYIGNDFTYILDGTTEIVEGDFNYEHTAGLITIDGKMINPLDSSNKDFIVTGGTTMEKLDGTKFTIFGSSDNLVYYTEYPAREAEIFCEEGHSCIVNTPGDKSKSGFRDRLAFINVQEGDDILVSSPVYYSHLEVTDMSYGGKVEFESYKCTNCELEDVVDGNVPKKHKFVSKLNVGYQGDISTIGRLENTNAGRVDISYVKRNMDTGDKDNILYHWGSNQNQKGADYFTKPRDHFLQCTPNVNCEEVFAQNFGKVIPARDRSKKPATTIIVGGDNAYTAKGLEKYCRVEGCYILNSRDVPPKTDSKHLIVTGHHWADTGHIWRDSTDVETVTEWDEVNQEMVTSTSHNPIDRLYLDNSPLSSSQDSLPRGDNVESVAFSACNTVLLKKDYPVLQDLTDKYPALDLVQGWAGTAPLNENIKGNPNINNPDLAARSNGKRAWYTKSADGEWLITDDGRTCTNMGDFSTTGVNTPVSCGNSLALQ